MCNASSLGKFTDAEFFTVVMIGTNLQKPPHRKSLKEMLVNTLLDVLGRFGPQFQFLKNQFMAKEALHLRTAGSCNPQYINTCKKDGFLLEQAKNLSNSDVHIMIWEVLPV